MRTLGWLVIGIAFLLLVMVVNNSWTVLWDKFKAKENTTSSQPTLPKSGTDAAQTDVGNASDAPTTGAVPGLPTSRTPALTPDPSQLPGITVVTPAGGMGPTA